MKTRGPVGKLRIPGRRGQSIKSGAGNGLAPSTGCMPTNAACLGAQDAFAHSRCEINVLFTLIRASSYTSGSPALLTWTFAVPCPCSCTRCHPDLHPRGPQVVPESAKAKGSCRCSASPRAVYRLPGETRVRVVPNSMSRRGCSGSRSLGRDNDTSVGAASPAPEVRCQRSPVPA
jgi:hypothetical protein